MLALTTILREYKVSEILALEVPHAPLGDDDIVYAV